MAMQKSVAAENPDAYIASLGGWQQRYARALRAAVAEAAALREGVKWGHLVYFANGPVLLIRAEPERVLFGFWRGQRLRGLEPRLKAGGKYEMATLELREGTPLDRDTVMALARDAVALDAALGDPTDLRPRAARSPQPVVPSRSRRPPVSRRARRRSRSRRSSITRTFQSALVNGLASRR